ncbi:SLATT domain-containing protein [Sphingomonas floccifaciens]|uniref:SLATT domain-containing protein n=1 Tax=Sphingomonas floccifaciens TaxID=1844115 RepID=A0ABW4NEG4_9SPHN
MATTTKPSACNPAFVNYVYEQMPNDGAGAKQGGTMTIGEGDRARIIDEGRKLATDVLYSEKAHFAAAGRWRYWQFWLGNSAAVLAALAGAGFLSKVLSVELQSWLPAVLAFVASLITILVTNMKPDQIWEKHHAAGVDYGIVRRKIRQFVQITARAEGADEKKLAETLDELTEEVGAIQKRARPIPGYAHAKAYKSIHAGQSDYEQKELDAATGPIA